MKLHILIVIVFVSIGVSAANAQTTRLKCIEGLASTESDYKRWLERDAAYLITAAEKDALLKLTTNEEREKFVEDFWLRRDPTPGTGENEFQTEYYTRIAYANEHFASGIAGWRTNRGKTYIARGKPDRLEQGKTPAYDEAVPYEKWYYAANAPTEFIFVDPTQSGEFRLLTPEIRKNYPHL